jgi:hypothetical protein
MPSAWAWWTSSSPELNWAKLTAQKMRLGAARLQVIGDAQHRLAGHDHVVDQKDIAPRDVFAQKCLPTTGLRPSTVWW